MYLIVGRGSAMIGANCCGAGVAAGGVGGAASSSAASCGTASSSTAAAAAAAAAAGCGGYAGWGCTGWFMYASLFVDCFFCIFCSFINNFLLIPAVPLMELVFLRRAGVSATNLSGTLYAALNTEATRTVCSHIIHFMHHLYLHPAGISVGVSRPSLPRPRPLRLFLYTRGN